MKKNIIIGVLILIILVLLGKLSSDQKNLPVSREEVEDQTPENTEEAQFDITDIGASDGADPNITVSSAEHSRRPSPVVRGKTIYDFSAVSWLFTETQTATALLPLTTVRISLDNFTRSGSAIDLATFRLGQHQGVCSEVESVPFSENDGLPLAFAQCLWAQQGSQLAVFQKDNLIILKMRQISEKDLSSAPLQEINTIDLTGLIQ